MISYSRDEQTLLARASWRREGGKGEGVVGMRREGRKRGGEEGEMG